jgi:hypothetical protein
MLRKGQLKNGAMSRLQNNVIPWSHKVTFNPRFRSSNHKLCDRAPSFFRAPSSRWNLSSRRESRIVNQPSKTVQYTATFDHAIEGKHYRASR